MLKAAVMSCSHRKNFWDGRSTAKPVGWHDWLQVPAQFWLEGSWSGTPWVRLLQLAMEDHRTLLGWRGTSSQSFQSALPQGAPPQTWTANMLPVGLLWRRALLLGFVKVRGLLCMLLLWREHLLDELQYLEAHLILGNLINIHPTHIVN